MSRHSRTDSVAISGAAWLPPFGARVQELLAAPLPEPTPLAFVPIGWVDATFPRSNAAKGTKTEAYLTQLRRAVKDLSRTREVASDSSSNHALMLHSLEGMAEAYQGLLESVRAMIRFQENELVALRKAAGGAAAATTAGYASPTPASPALANTITTSPSPALSADSRAQSPYSPPNGRNETPSPLSSTGGANGTNEPDKKGAVTPAAPSNPLAELQAEQLALLLVRKHCVRTLRAFRNLHLLVCGVDCLRDVLADSEYQAARLAFAAITELFATLQLYSKLPVLSALNDHVEYYKGQLRKDIFAAFREHMGNSAAVSGPASPRRPGQLANASKMQSLVRLHHCCRLIDLLYSSLERKELVKWWIAVQLHAYQSAVSRRQFGDVSGLGGNSPVSASGSLIAFDHLDAQFGWITTELRDSYDPEYAQVFPPAWFVDALLTRRFFELVRAQFAATLETLERRVAEENERRRAVGEAKKAQRIMQDIEKIQHGSSGGGGSGEGGQQRRSRSHSSMAGEANGNGTSGGAGSDNASATSTSTAASKQSEVDSLDSTPLTFDFYKPLLRTIEFEQSMRAKWLNEKTEASLCEEDLYAVLGAVPNPAEDLAPGQSPPSNPPPHPFQFAGYISSAFHPYLPSMVLSERNRFYNFLESLDEMDAWEVESADVASAHFSEATKLFVMVSKSMERYAKVMPGDCFLDLFREYRTALSNYVELLSKHLPQIPPASGSSSSSSGSQSASSSSSSGGGGGSGNNRNNQLLQEEEMQSLCATINTGDYISDRCGELATTVVSMLSGRTPEQLLALEDGGGEEDAAADADPELAQTRSFISVLREQVDLSGVEEQVSHLNHRATHVLAANIVRKLRPALQHMKEAGRGAGGAGGGSSSSSGGGGGSMSGGGGGGSIDENKYIREIQQCLRAQLSDKARMSSFAYLAQVVAVDFLKEYHATLRSCSSHFKITEQTAQQMLLDLQALKHFLINAVQDWKREAQRIQTQGRRAKEADDLKAQLAEGGSGGSSSLLNGAPPVAPAFKAYVKLLHAQILPSELLLKSLTSPTARLIATFKTIVPNSSDAQVYELLSLRGLSSSEQEKVIKAYNATQANPQNHIAVIKKDFFGQMTQMVRDVKHTLQ